MQEGMILSVNNLGIRRSERWLFQQLSCQLSTHQIVQVTGENGAGKTSLLRALCGLLPYQEGTLEWQTEDQMSIIPTYLGHLPAVKAELTVLENIRYHPINGQFHSEQAIEQAIVEVGLAPHIDRMAKHLSAGQVRRIALARLRLSNAKCWILDEPFTALDVAACDWLCNIISAYVRQGGAVILTSHQPVELDVPIKEMPLKQNMSDYV